MRFLADQDVYGLTVRFLVSLGHDVVPVAQLGVAQAKDADLLRLAHHEGRVFVTRDRDFGALVFVQGSGPGVIYLRILPSTQASVHAELARVLTYTANNNFRRPSSSSNPAAIASARWDRAHRRNPAIRPR